LLAPAQIPKSSLFLRADKLKRYAQNTYEKLDDVFGLSPVRRHSGERSKTLPLVAANRSR
jgi:hypothetical protein